MTVSPLRIDGWRGPGCGADCLPRSHDPIVHERYGYERALEKMHRTIVRTGNLTVDLGSRTVHVDGAEIHPSGREWDILAYLAERIGRGCASVEMARALWPNEPTTAGAVACLGLSVYRLRRRLGTAGRLITTRQNQSVSTRRLENVEPS